MDELVLFPEREDLLPRPRPRKVPVRGHERQLPERLTPTEREARRRREENARGKAAAARARRQLEARKGRELP